MSSNLSMEAKLAYQAYLDANSLDERIAKLEIFLSKVPKHKATEQIVALNKTKISKLKAERETELKRRKALTAAMEDPFTIKKEPHTLQIMLISDFFEHAGVGKTTLLKSLTGLTEARPGIFTPTPNVGIFDWNHIKFQLVDEPALQHGRNLSRCLAAMKTTDIICILLDLTRNPVDQFQTVLEHLNTASIYLNRRPPNIQITKTGSGGMQLFFLSKAAKKSEPLTPFLHEMGGIYGSKNLVVKIHEEVTVEEIAMAFNRASTYIPALVVATKADLPNTKENYTILQKFLAKAHPSFTIMPVAVVSTKDGPICKGFDEFGQIILEKLNMIRIFTKSSKGVAEQPLVLPRESTIKDVALKIHKDLYKTFKYAMVYRSTNELPVKSSEYTVEQKLTRIKAGLQFKIEEKDIIEIHSRI